MKNIIVVSNHNDPYMNQALEYYLLTELTDYSRVLFLWINAPSVFIGRNQNPWKETNMAYLEKNKVPFLRRKSGGGTVFHDHGNLNISFIDPLSIASAESNLGCIQKALADFSVSLEASRRHDLKYKGKKVTGSAFYLHKKRKLHHCTLLVDVDENQLWQSLRFSDEDIHTKSVRSIRSPVANLARVRSDISIESVMNRISKTYMSTSAAHPVKLVDVDSIVEDWTRVDSLKKMFSSESWLYEETPEFKFRTESGQFLTVRNGKIQEEGNRMFSKSQFHLIHSGKSGIKRDETSCDALEGGNTVNLDKYNPLTDEMIQIMDKDGNILHPELMPDIREDKLLNMYKTMVKSRVTDIKTLQFQRQGRILTYAPNLGQEAAQVGTIAASEKTDWVASAFRELGAWLYRESPLYNILLYWFGNESGMHMPEHVRILPVSVPIASQLQHATGLAFASVYKGEKDVVLGYVGDGGTSQGDFHEALNFAGVKDLPCVFIVQNNQFAISTRRAIQTKSKTIAQKALAYGMPGYQVDGNDIFAVYAVTKLAVDRARNGQGPTLIEAYTYRMGAHTTADDPTVYRDETEVDEWKDKDPIDRLRKYLINQGLWSEEQDKDLFEAYEEEVRTTFEKVEQSGLVPLEDVFDYTYESKTSTLDRQYKELKKRAEEAK